MVEEGNNNIRTFELLTFDYATAAESSGNVNGADPLRNLFYRSFVRF